MQMFVLEHFSCEEENERQIPLAYISVWSIVPSGLASLCEFEYRNFMVDSKIPLAFVSRTSKL